MTIKHNILRLFNNKKAVGKTEQQIFAGLRVHRGEYNLVRNQLKNLERDGSLIRVKSGKYYLRSSLKVVQGVVDAHARGFAFLIPDGYKKGENDYFIPPRSLFGALNKDRVLAVKVPETEDEVEVVQIIERGQTTLVGTFIRDRSAGYVTPDDNKFDCDVYIPLPLSLDAQHGDKVICQVTSYPKGRMPGGKIIEILGEGGDFYVEELSIIRSFGLQEEFPPAVERQAQEVSQQPIEVGSRSDLRQLLTVTIDGDDTRDIDDAISIEKVGSIYRLGVHIADVTHYVARSSKLDKEAYSRGTSVYFPDRVLPMLPKALSNGACSLNEGEDRYALSCFMTFNSVGERIESNIVESVINSHKRLTYREVERIINDENDNSLDPQIIQMLRDARDLAKILQSRRNSAGSINLDVKEARIYVDKNQELIIPDYEELFSYSIIEQFMVSANEAVAEKMCALEVPFLYRVHELPSPEKVNTFLSFIADLGITANISSDQPTPKQFSAVIDRVEGLPFAPVVNRVMLRSMMKARYSDENLGHFGLASQCYCHFTSPIRRYPDLFIHRVIKEVLLNGAQSAIKKFNDIAHTAAIDTSQRERIADEAERAVDDLYKTVYMDERIGEEFEATVSGVTSFGVFCELNNTIEGIIPLDILPSDSYEYDENKFMLRGKKLTFRLGDSVRIRVDNCDWTNMRPQFSYLGHNNR